MGMFGGQWNLGAPANYGFGPKRHIEQALQNYAAERAGVRPQGNLTAPRRNTSERLGDFVSSGLRRAGVSDRRAEKLGGKLATALEAVTPIGDATGGIQAGQDLRQGNLLSGGLGALATFLPGAAKGMFGRGIRAWHGSPHDFDKFSLDKIGTGEGAQAYGHGLYFAENKDVARSYMGSAQVPEATAATWALQQASGDPDLAISLLERSVRQGVKLEHSPALQAAEQLRNGYRGQRLYEVNINKGADSFLDWDAPISGQSSSIIKPLERFGISPNARGEDAYSKVVREVSGSDDYWKIGSRRPSAMATEALREAGLPGVRYLDQGSRGRGGGTRNYVVFDPSLIDILNKY